MSFHNTSARRSSIALFSAGFWILITLAAAQGIAFESEIHHFLGMFNVYDITLVGDHAYLGGYNNYEIDITDPSAMDITWQYGYGSSDFHEKGLSVATNGNYVVFPSQFLEHFSGCSEETIYFSMLLMNIAEHPLVLTLDSHLMPQTVYCSDNAAKSVVAAMDESHIYTVETVSWYDWSIFEVFRIDYPEPSTRTALLGLSGPGTAHDIALSGDHAFIVFGGPGEDDGWLEVIDISDPARPLSVAKLYLWSEAYGMAISGDQGYVKLSERVAALDISDPADPQFLSNTGAYYPGTEIDLAGTHVYTAGSHLSIFDISLFPHLRAISTTPILTHEDYYATGIAVSGNSIMNTQAFITYAGTLENYIGLLYSVDICPCDADINRDGVLNLMDAALFAGCMDNSPLPECDLSCDDLLDACDQEIFNCQYFGGGPECCADINLNNIPDVCEDVTATLDDTLDVSPTTLYAASPNPLTASTTVSFALKSTQPVALNVFDVQGRRVASLLNDSLPSGPHSIVWDGRDNSGSRVSSGIYFMQLETGGRRINKKVVVLR